jgi:divalent metal cation (Fe/Co/Zn/Cd) transporter
MQNSAAMIAAAIHLSSKLLSSIFGLLAISRKGSFPSFIFYM